MDRRVERFLLISDGHGAVDALTELQPVAKDCDAVIFAGDFAAFNEPETGLPFLQALSQLHPQVFAVLGNCDEPSFTTHMSGRVTSLENTPQKWRNYLLCGSGGGSYFTGTTPFERSDEALVSDLGSREQCKHERASGRHLIFVVHNPPHNTLADTISAGAHVGSVGIRSFIEETEPLLVVCGHIHEGVSIDAINKTTVVNPGSLYEGRYAVAEIIHDEKGCQVHAQLHALF